MNQISKNTLPIPDCWRESWQHHASANDLYEFPTRAYLETNPRQARGFCAWLWQQLAANNGELCKQPSTVACRQCQSQSVSEVIAVRILGLLVRNIDLTLHFYLDHRFEEIMKGYPVSRPGRRPRPDSSPNSEHKPPSPLAAIMPAPRRWIFTNAVARELRKYRYWLDEQ